MSEREIDLEWRVGKKEYNTTERLPPFLSVTATLFSRQDVDALTAGIAAIRDVLPETVGTAPNGFEVRWRGHRHKWAAMEGETVLREGMESREEAEAFIRNQPSVASHV